MTMGPLVSPAQLVGYVALVLGVSAFLQKRDVQLKVLISGESIAYFAHFILLGNFAAAGSAMISCLRNLISLKSRSPWWVAVFVVLNLIVGVLLAKHLIGWLPVAASCLATGAMFLLRGIFMRLVLLICTLLWLGNNILSGSIGGTILEALIAVTNLSTIIRLTSERFFGIRHDCPTR